ncbi:MAG: DUF3526 domain-containing protein [Erythrobacter sp.]
MLRLIAMEWRALLRDRAVWALLVVLAGALVLAAANGRAVIDAQSGARSAALTAEAEAQQQLATRLANPGLPPAEAVLTPYRMRTDMIAPMPLLSDLSAGRAALDPISTTATMRTRPDTLFRRNSLDNPEILVRGAVDLSFVVVVLAPLLLIGLFYGLFAADRDSGTARLIMAQAGSPAGLVLARMVPRLALVVGPIAAVLGLLVVTGPELAGRGQAAALWLLTAAIYLALWAALAAWVHSRNVTAESAVFSLVAIWAVFTLVLPAAFAAIVQASNPPPSRFAQIAAARAAEVASTQSYENDHPDLASSEFEGRLASIRKTWAVAQAIEAAGAPLNARFAERLEGQQRVAKALAWLSPALIAKGALEQIAGTDAATAQGFRAASEAHLSAFRSFGGGFVERGAIMQTGDMAQMPRFDWEPSRHMPWPSLALLALLAGALMTSALRRFGKLTLED